MEEKNDIIKSLGKNANNAVIQKSTPLLDLWMSDLTLQEFKIIDVYLARINSHEPEKRTVIFEKGELEALLKVKRIQTKDLEERLKHLMGHIVKLSNKEKTDGFELVTLFERAVTERDKYGVWQVELTASNAAMKYIFNVDNIGYLRYKLRSIISLSSRYSYILFLYLEKNRKWHKSWEISLPKIKELLKCDNEKIYTEYKVFSSRILKKAQKELKEKTDCKFAYEPIKRGRTVVGIRFTLEDLPENAILETEYTPSTDETQLLDRAVAQENEEIKTEIVSEEDQTAIEELKRSDVPNDIIDMLQVLKANCDNSFTLLELYALLIIVSDIPIDRLPTDNEEQHGAGKDLESVMWRRQKYIHNHYAFFKSMKAKKQSKGEPILNEFKYFTSLIKNDIKDLSQR